MKRIHIIFITMLGMLCALPLQAAVVETLSSGNARLQVSEAKEAGQYQVTFLVYDNEFNASEEYNPTLVIDCYMKTFYANYTDYKKENGKLTMTARFTATPSTVVFVVTDIYEAKGDGSFALDRDVRVESLGDNPYKNGFYTSFGLQFSDTNELLDYDYFIPGVWYKPQFTIGGNIPSGIPTKDDTNFFYRDDRTPLPVVMMRDKTTGLAVFIVDQDSPCRTVLADASLEEQNENYQYGGVGVVKRKKTEGFCAVATYPGSDNRQGGIGERRHPFVEGFDRHHYKVFFNFAKTDDYGVSFEQAWDTAFNLYNPEIRYEDQTHAYKALIETVDYYYLSQDGDSRQSVSTKQPGFPWGVNLKNFSLNATTFELGFVGCQPNAGYALLRYGLDNDNESYASHGKKVIDFWARSGLSSLGLPRSRYYNQSGMWDMNGTTTIRQAATGMNGVLNAYCYYLKKTGTKQVQWLTACEKFGQWLVKNQQKDGSFYMEYDYNRITNGAHPIQKYNKYLTICAVRYLVELYLTTMNEEYLEAARKAADWSLSHTHKSWLYVASVIDNPQTIDSESGIQALQGFLSMYDLTKEAKWLEAAEQAATYTETWAYMHEVPVEDDQTGETDWPRDRSIVGQHIITVAQPACDLGFAWCSFAFYRMYLYTGKERYLKMARISAHNTKQSMNLHQALYPGRQEGLQQEAFTIRTANHSTRRQNSVMEALTWNFAAHLDPMIRFLDAFGTPDIEAIEEMDKNDVLRMNEEYSILQAADYGQDISDIREVSALRKDGGQKVYLEGSLLHVVRQNAQGKQEHSVYTLAGALVKRTVED
ncbi:MAG: hypothetical protein IJ196_03075 [Prevotella sp.]|nr:hypothetical protein [Prevotella sp.]